MAIFVSGCKKEALEPSNTNYVLSGTVALADWGYDNTTVDGVLAAADYKIDPNIKTCDDCVETWDGYADLDYYDETGEIVCDPAEAICAIIIRARKDNEDNHVIIAATPNSPEVISNVQEYKILQSGDGKTKIVFKK